MQWSLQSLSNTVWRILSIMGCQGTPQIPKHHFQPFEIFFSPLWFILGPIGSFLAVFNAKHHFQACQAVKYYFADSLGWGVLPPLPPPPLHQIILPIQIYRIGLYSPAPPPLPFAKSLIPKFHSYGLKMVFVY